MSGCGRFFFRTMEMQGMRLLLYRRGRVRAHQGGWGSGHGSEGLGNTAWLAGSGGAGSETLPKLKKEIVGASGVK